MKLKCDCGWEGEMWDAAITLYWEEPKVLIACPSCPRSVTIATEPSLVYVLRDADGMNRFADIPGEARQ